MEMQFQGCSFSQVKEKAIQIYQSNSDILDFKISRKRDADIWIVKFNKPNPIFQKLMLDNPIPPTGSGKHKA